MAAQSGRRVRIKKDGTVIAGARTDTLTINNEPVDVTDKGDDGWRTLLPEVGLRSIEATVEGVLKDSTLVDASMGSTSAMLSAYSVEIENIGTFSGDFFLNSLEIGGEHAGELTFSASIQSSGQITYAAAV